MPRVPAPRICTLEIRADGKQYQSSIELSFLKPFETLPTATVRVSNGPKNTPLERPNFFPFKIQDIFVAHKSDHDREH